MVRKYSRHLQQQDKLRKQQSRNAQRILMYHQTDNAWRQRRSHELDIPFSNSSLGNSFDQPVPLTPPKDCHNILGDGNCFLVLYHM